MSKIAIGMVVRLAARWNGRGIEDLIAGGTNDARDDDLIGDEKLQWKSGQVRLDRIAAGHALERRDGGLCAVARIQRRKTAPAKRRKKLVGVLVEDRIGSDLELHDLGAAGLRRQEIQPVDPDRCGAQPSSCVMDTSDERGRVIGGYAVDRHVKRLDPLAAEIGLKSIDKRRAGGRGVARRGEQDTDVPSGRRPGGRAYRRQTRGPIVCTRVAAPLIASTIRRSVKSLTGRGRSLGSNQPTSV